MPANTQIRSAYFLNEIIKNAGDSDYVSFEKKEFIEKACFILGYSSPTSVWGIIYYLKGGKLIQETNINSIIIYKIDVKSAQVFINKQHIFFEKTKDKKIKGVSNEN